MDVVIFILVSANLSKAAGDQQLYSFCCKYLIIEPSVLKCSLRPVGGILLRERLCNQRRLGLFRGNGDAAGNECRVSGVTDGGVWSVLSM